MKCNSFQLNSNCIYFSNNKLLNESFRIPIRQWHELGQSSDQCKIRQRWPHGKCPNPHEISSSMLPEGFCCHIHSKLIHLVPITSFSCSTIMTNSTFIKFIWQKSYSCNLGTQDSSKEKPKYISEKHQTTLKQILTIL